MTALQEGIQRVNDEAGGLLELRVIQQSDLRSLILDMLAGSADAAQLLRMANDAVTSIQAAPRRKPALCGACPRTLLGKRFSIILARPACDDPTQALALAICPTCGPDYDAIQAKATVALSRIWPNLRPVTVTHPEGGRA